MPREVKKTQSGTKIHEILPEEIFVMILKKLDFKDLAMSRGICTHWRKVIEGFELLSLKSICKFW